MSGTQICHSTRSKVQRKSCHAHPQGDVTDLCQLYQVRISPMMYGCHGDMKMLPPGTKGGIAVEVISLYLQLQDDICFWKTFSKGECIFCTNFRSGQICAFSFKNEAATIIALLSTPLLILSRIKIDPHVAPDKCSRFDLPTAVSCTASLVHGYRLLWNGSWLIQLTDNQVYGCPAEKSLKMDDPDAYLHRKFLDPALATKMSLSNSPCITRLFSTTLNSIYVLFMFSLGWAFETTSTALPGSDFYMKSY